MLSAIQTSGEKQLFEAELYKVSQLINKQFELPKDARVTVGVIHKLVALQNYLLEEIEKYERIQSLE